MENFKLEENRNLGGELKNLESKLEKKYFDNVDVAMYEKGVLSTEEFEKLLEKNQEILNKYFSDETHKSSDDTFPIEHYLIIDDSGDKYNAAIHNGHYYSVYTINETGKLTEFLISRLLTNEDNEIIATHKIPTELEKIFKNIKSAIANSELEQVSQ